MVITCINFQEHSVHPFYFCRAAMEQQGALMFVLTPHFQFTFSEIRLHVFYDKQQQFCPVSLRRSFRRNYLHQQLEMHGDGLCMEGQR